MVHPINRTLLAVLENQVRRTAAALEGLHDDVFLAEPGGDCNSILAIGRHLVILRRFQLILLESPLADEAPDPESIETLGALATALDRGSDLVARAIGDHDPDDWERMPNPPRDGKWGDEPTLQRFVRPFNDFTNHLGGIRAIRRTRGNPNDRTQRRRVRSYVTTETNAPWHRTRHRTRRGRIFP